ncbi:neurocan core protein-like [Branchiostoma lanceolatum]|uniref:neurocan core protein-like n=1 Tax=Branchiostoma lanceolatum TaxID=7740 RepID=UPI003452C2C3
MNALGNQINECTRKPCQHGRCVNKDGGYKCVCSPGWIGQNCQQDIDECLRRPCGHGTCVNTDGDFRCTCSPGWTGQNCQQAKRCQSGWREHNNHCYKLMGDITSFLRAHKRCQDRRANLASIHNKTENDFIKDLVTSAPEGDQPIVYIGLKWNGGRWGWSDGSPLSYSNWAPGEPNRQSYLSLSPECAAISSKTGKQWLWGNYRHKGEWTDQRCTGNYAYICKAPK